MSQRGGDLSGPRPTKPLRHIGPAERAVRDILSRARRGEPRTTCRFGRRGTVWQARSPIPGGKRQYAAVAQNRRPSSGLLPRIRTPRGRVAALRLLRDYSPTGAMAQALRIARPTLA
jgi:hypothetical protein